MNYNVISIPPFDKQLKRLSKKYPSLKKEFANLIELLEVKPKQGTALGSNCFKFGKHQEQQILEPQKFSSAEALHVPHLYRHF